MFIGRTQELQFLNEHYHSSKAEFIVLYGRRRVGKTELLTEFCKDKPNLFYACTETTDKQQFAKFSECVLSFGNSRSFIKAFADWEDVFSRLPDLTEKEKLVVVIDEFPYMCKGNSGIPSILQALWDHKLKHSNLMLVICGSSLSFMEDEILSSKNPLYGRMTGNYKLEPLPFSDAIKFFPRYSTEEKVIAYSILGGIPHYLIQFDEKLSLQDNIIKNILSKGAVLFNEVEYILHQEFREPAVYNTIAEAIAYGSCRFNEIGERSQLESSKLYPYLKAMIEIGLISHEFSVTESSKNMTKRTQGEYKLTDSFFAFWYSFCYPYLSELVQGEAQTVYEEVIQPNLHRISASPFENICISYLRDLRKAGKTPFRFLKIGRFWGKVTHRDEGTKPYTTSEEIDIYATDSTQTKYILGECKFTGEPFDMGQLKKLQAKLSLQGEVWYYLFSLSGFTDGVKEYAAAHSNTVLITADDILSQ